LLEDLAILIQELKKLAREVQTVYVLGVRFGDYVRDDWASSLKQLTIELGMNRMGQQSPKCKVGGSQENSDDGAEKQHHPEPERSDSHDPGVPRRYPTPRIVWMSLTERS